MCKVLKISRSSYYYKAKERKEEKVLVTEIVEIFRRSRNNYGTRKIKSKLSERNRTVSRRRISRIMKQEGLVSSYTKAKYRTKKDTCNDSKIENKLDRQFSKQPYRNVVVSDLTYVRVGNRWHYICILVDLFNREIIGFSAGKNKSAELVKKAFQSVKGDLQDIQIFHTDRGNEFKNKAIDKTLSAFKIHRSLSHKGCPYDNAVAESTFKIIKTEFINNRTFNSLYHLQIELADYVNWFNHHRIHSSLRYLSPVNYKLNTLNLFV
jgi:transposase InsO family protein